MTIIDRVYAAVSVAEGQYINGRQLADKLNHPRDYVLYVLREHPRVCRHSVGDGIYFIHTHADPCRKYDHTQGRRVTGRQPCPSCYLPLTVTGECNDCI